MTEIFIIMVITNYNSTEDMINKLQQLKGKTKLKFYKLISNYYDEMKQKNFKLKKILLLKMLKVLVKFIMK